LTLDSDSVQYWNVTLSKRLALATLLVVTAGVAVLTTQGLRVRRTALRLPDAVGPTRNHGSAAGEPLLLYVIGDSVASGVGVDDHDHTIAGRLADLLAAKRPVRRTVIAESGHTAADTTTLIAGRLAGADVVVISTGVNDTKNLHSLRRWRHDLTALLDSVTAQAPATPVVLLGLPPMETFPAMPWALGLALGARARSLDRVGRKVAARYDAVVRLELPRREFAAFSEPFARDGFHPSARLHQAFAHRIYELLEEGHSQRLTCELAGLETSTRQPGAATPRAAPRPRVRRGRACDPADARAVRAGRRPRRQR
jgi:lysophospholipase L1-like esterase